MLQEETFAIGRCIGVVESIDLGCTRILDEQNSFAEFENIKQTLIVELSLEGLPQPILGTPKRKLLKEGSVRFSKRKNCRLYLFNDMIVLAEKIVNSLQHKYLKTIYPYELAVEASGSKIQLQIDDSSGNSSTETLSFKSNKSEWPIALQDFVENYKKNCVFGVELDTVIEREQLPEGIPFVLAITMKYIRNYGMNTEGIFRVPGDGLKIETFKRVFDSGATEVDFRGCSVHDVGGILKLYLRELPVPLIPFEYYPIFITIQKDFESQNNEENYLDSIASILTKIPIHNRHVLHKVIEFLQELCRNEKTTKMGTENLSMVFTPNVIRPLQDTIDTAMQSLIIARLFEYMIVHYEKLMSRAIELDPRLVMHYDHKDESTDKTTRKKSRYSMDAFDPLLCDEIPLPVAMSTSKSLRLPRRDSFRKSPKKKFPAKISPREGEPQDNPEVDMDEDITQSKAEWRRSRSTGTLANSLAVLKAKSLKSEEEDDDEDAVIRVLPAKRRKSQTNSASLSKHNSQNLWSILSPRTAHKKKVNK